jgi:putative acetyltransferase
VVPERIVTSRAEESGAPIAHADGVTTETPEPVAAPAWSIRPELPIDIDQINELLREAFRGPAEAELVDAVRAGTDFIPELSLVAVAADGSVLGHVLVSKVAFQPEDPASPRRDVLALAPLAVLPAHWGRGIGSALTREALAVADERPEPLIAVLGAPSFYGRFGFVAASDAGIRSPYDAAGPAYQVRPNPEATLEPGEVIYPPVFGSI